MKSNLVTAYICNLIDMVLVLFCYDIGIYMPRLFFDKATTFMAAKVMLVGASLLCTWEEYQSGRCSDGYFKFKCYMWRGFYAFLIAYDVFMIIGGVL
jgi:hypothetical protein